MSESLTERTGPEDAQITDFHLPHQGWGSCSDRLVLLTPYLKSLHFPPPDICSSCFHLNVFFPSFLSTKSKPFRLDCSSYFSTWVPSLRADRDPTPASNHSGPQEEGPGGCLGMAGKVGGLEWEGQGRRIGCGRHILWHRGFLGSPVSGSSACSMDGMRTRWIMNPSP